MAGLNPETMKKVDTLQSSPKDMKIIQYLTDKATRVVSLIELNMETISVFIRKLEAISQAEATPLARSSSELIDFLKQSHQEHRFHLIHALSLKNRAGYLSDQVRYE